MMTDNVAETKRIANYYYYVRILIKTYMITLHYELSLNRTLDYQASILETRMAIYHDYDRPTSLPSLL